MQTKLDIENGAGWFLSQLMISWHSNQNVQNSKDKFNKFLHLWTTHWIGIWIGLLFGFVSKMRGIFSSFENTLVGDQWCGSKQEGNVTESSDTYYENQCKLIGCSTDTYY